jgi:hypothetical protein
LHADALEGITERAREIAAAAVKLGVPGEPIRTAAGALERAADVKAARAAFGDLGDSIMRAATRLRVGLFDDVKAAYCPMVGKYWLQKGEKVQNPFYDSAMADCGRLVPGIPNLPR